MELRFQFYIVQLILKHNVGEENIIAVSILHSTINMINKFLKEIGKAMFQFYIVQLI